MVGLLVIGFKNGSSMYRSFTDRIFGGVCGGLGAVFRVSAWWLRAIFIILSIITLGAFAALYLLLWWSIPQESLVGRRRSGAGRLLLVIVLAVATGVAYLVHVSGGLRGPSGQDLFWPGMLLLLSAVFFLKQVRA